MQGESKKTSIFTPTSLCNIFTSSPSSLNTSQNNQTKSSMTSINSQGEHTSTNPQESPSLRWSFFLCKSCKKNKMRNMFDSCCEECEEKIYLEKSKSIEGKRQIFTSQKHSSVNYQWLSSGYYCKSCRAQIKNIYSTPYCQRCGLELFPKHQEVKREESISNKLNAPVSDLRAQFGRYFSRVHHMNFSQDKYSLDKIKELIQENESQINLYLKQNQKLLEERTKDKETIEFLEKKMKKLVSQQDYQDLRKKYNDLKKQMGETAVIFDEKQKKMEGEISNLKKETKQKAETAERSTELLKCECSQQEKKLHVPNFMFDQENTEKWRQLNVWGQSLKDILKKITTELSHTKEEVNEAVRIIESEFISSTKRTFSSLSNLVIHILNRAEEKKNIELNLLYEMKEQFEAILKLRKDYFESDRRQTWIEPLCKDIQASSNILQRIACLKEQTSYFSSAQCLQSHSLSESRNEVKEEYFADSKEAEPKSLLPEQLLQEGEHGEVVVLTELE